MTEKQIKAEMRLWALECIVCQHWASMLIAEPDDFAKETHERLVSAARTNAFPGMNPALSDHYAAEFETAIQRLVKMQQEYMAIGRS